jgi:GNAT superfamily N-acetyltransferase
MRIRTASLDDYEAICALFDELDEFHRRARPEMFQSFAGPVRERERIARWLADADSTILVAEGDAGVVGLAVLLTNAPSGFAGAVARKVIEVSNLVVRADQRNQRVGRQLLMAAMDWARQHQATHVEVAVHDVNRDARRFYEDFGFTPSVTRLVLAA